MSSSSGINFVAIITSVLVSSYVYFYLVALVCQYTLKYDLVLQHKRIVLQTHYITSIILLLNVFHYAVVVLPLAPLFYGY